MTLRFFPGEIIDCLGDVSGVQRHKEGETILELKKLIEEEKNINVLVLAAKSDPSNKNPGPIITSLVSNEITNLRVPIMIVPGNFSIEHITLIT